MSVALTASPPDSIRKSTAYRYRQPLSVVLMLGGWLGAVVSAPMIQEGTRADHLADVIGWLLLALGAGLRYWSILHIAGRKSRSVVDTGPYALCRNPLYMGTLLLVGCEAAFLKSAWFLICSFLLAAIYIWGVVPAEERWLTRRMDDAYAAYYRSVPRWLPRFNKRCLQGATVKDRRASRTEIIHIVWWCALLPLIAELTPVLREAVLRF